MTQQSTVVILNDVVHKFDQLLISTVADDRVAIKPIRSEWDLTLEKLVYYVSVEVKVGRKWEFSRFIYFRLPVDSRQVEIWYQGVRVG
ncbi:MAG TPA: hypothetical protein VGP24_12925 [Glaciihabitans sp.]|nr:hypothetical protein [Glaciihabitans sp.]